MAVTGRLQSPIRSVSNVARPAEGQGGPSLLVGLQDALAELRTSSGQWHRKLVELLRLLEAVDAVIDELDQAEAKPALREAIQIQRRALIQAARRLHQQIAMLSRIQDATDRG
jgi:hypothetical protein